MSSMTFIISQDKSGGLVSDPASQTAVTRNTDIIFLFAKTAPASFKFSGYTSTDSKQQLGPAQISGDGRTMTIPNLNSQSETMVITSMVDDGNLEGSLRSNSEVINDPPN